MIIRGKNIGRKVKAPTDFQNVLYEKAKKEGWYEQVAKGELRIATKSYSKKLLEDLRIVFPKTIIGLYKIDGKWVYTIYKYEDSKKAESIIEEGIELI